MKNLYLLLTFCSDSSWTLVMSQEKCYKTINMASVSVWNISSYVKSNIHGDSAKFWHVLQLAGGGNEYYSIIMHINNSVSCIVNNILPADIFVHMEAFRGD